MGGSDDNEYSRIGEPLSLGHGVAAHFRWNARGTADRMSIHALSRIFYITTGVLVSFLAIFATEAIAAETPA